MRTTLLLPLSLLLLLSSGCSTFRQPAVGTSRASFVSYCTNSNVRRGISRRTAAAVCACTYDRTRSHYSAAQWRSTVAAYERTGHNATFDRHMNEAAQTCVRRYSPEGR